ncbi:MAG: tRNA pseudouridine(55) synthase TruB [Cellulosilyticaceae bacterium]
MIHGIINIYKEKGYTSHDVVAKARGILRERKIGHTGTLDPDAEGVLPICIGKATKIVPYLTDADKCYEAEVILGAYTTTEDATGEIVESFAVNVTQEEIQKVVDSFNGAYTQVPPMYSAIKVGGVRLYELARKGIVVERPARTVYIYKCEIIEWLSKERFKIRVHCSKGTYIRTLCTDIGKTLGCGAHMGNLLRTQVGEYKLDKSIKLSELEQVRDHVEDYLDTLESIFNKYTKVYAKPSAEKALYNGNKLSFKDVSEFKVENEELIRVFDKAENFIGIYKVDTSSDSLIVDKMFFTKG